MLQDISAHNQKIEQNISQTDFSSAFPLFFSSFGGKGFRKTLRFPLSFHSGFEMNPKTIGCCLEIVWEWSELSVQPSVQLCKRSGSNV